MVIGITGQIGSGKSTAAAILKSLGAAVIDADKIGRQVVNNNPEVLKKLVRQFNESVLTKSHTLNRKRLAELAFENQSAKDKLNRIVHPHLLRELKKQLNGFKKSHDLVVIDAALLLDWDLDKDNTVDAVIMIHASEKDRLARLKKRGIDPNDALARQAQQKSFAEQRRRADYVILNNSTEKKLKEKLIATLLKVLRKTG